MLYIYIVSGYVEHAHTHTHIHIHLYVHLHVHIYIYIYQDQCKQILSMYNRSMFHYYDDNILFLVVIDISKKSVIKTLFHNIKLILDIHTTLHVTCILSRNRQLFVFVNSIVDMNLFGAFLS